MLPTALRKLACNFSEWGQDYSYNNALQVLSVCFAHDVHAEYFVVRMSLLFRASQSYNTKVGSRATLYSQSGLELEHFLPNLGRGRLHQQL